MRSRFGSREGFALEFHIERAPSLLCVDVHVGGLHVNAWDNAFYPPLLVTCLKKDAERFRAPSGPPAGFTSPAEHFRAAEHWWVHGDDGDFERYSFLEWGECTFGVRAFAFPDGDRVHLGCRTRDIEAGTEFEEGPSAVVTLDRAVFLETLEDALDVADREWQARRAAIT